MVILFLSPGFSQSDQAHAKSPEGQAYYKQSRSGVCDLPSSEEHAGFSTWAAGIVRQFGVEYEEVRSKIAFLNIGAYKSKSFNDWPRLIALPSCRMAVSWAQSSLFPEAENNKRIAICLRSARHWGLEPGKTYKGSLYAPVHGRGGIMNHGHQREEISKLVRAAVASQVQPEAKPELAFPRRGS